VIVIGCPRFFQQIGVEIDRITNAQKSTVGEKIPMANNLMDAFALQGKTAVITGGGGELCGAMAIGLGALGVNVAILDKNLDNAKKREETIRKAGGFALALACDVLVPAQQKDCCDTICKALGSVDFLVNGAGGNDPRGTTSEEFFDLKSMLDHDITTIYDLDLEAYRQVFDLNFLGTFLTTQIFSRPMVQKGSGSIVNISSLSAATPLTKVSAYSAAKAAVSNFTRWLAVYFARTGVRVNAIAPGAAAVPARRSGNGPALRPGTKGHRTHAPGTLRRIGRSYRYAHLAFVGCLKICHRKHNSGRWRVFSLQLMMLKLWTGTS
jgi:NAD(P)-dependent dehydrogenase (short-subunit alcohol dehydrogenase family)